MFRKSIHSKFAVWLALFSLVILGVAPTISKMRLANHDHCLMSFISPQDKADIVPAPSDSTKKISVTTVDKTKTLTIATTIHLLKASHFANHFHIHEKNTALDVDAACGYCQLLIHFPFITYCLLLLLLQLFRLVRQLIAYFIFNTYLFRSWARPSARAPPQSNYRFSI